MSGTLAKPSSMRRSRSWPSRPYGVSSREVAKRAGVNYGLVHYYFETKTELLTQAVQRELQRYQEKFSNAGEWRARTLENPPSATMLRAIFHLSLEWDSLGAAVFKESPLSSGRMEHLLELYGDGTNELRLRAAYIASTCLQMGWLVLAPQQIAATGATPAEADYIRAFIEEVVYAILPLALDPTPDKPKRPRRRRRAPEQPDADASATDARHALLDATIELLAERGSYGVSPREVAKRAGVNYGLVHYYFETRTELLAQAMRREIAGYDAMATVDREWQPMLILDPPSSTTLRSFFHLVLDWENVADVFADFAPSIGVRLHVLREVYGDDVDETRLRAAYVASSCLQLGWLAMAPQQLAAANATPRQRAQIRDFIVEVDYAILPIALAPPVERVSRGT